MKLDYSEIHIPHKNDTEDKIFSICDTQIKEFTKFITNMGDIKCLLPKRYLSQDYSDLNIDHAYLLKNGEIVHIEHHTNITRDLMSRNFQYETALHAATKKIIHPFIFNTGNIPDFKVDYASPTSLYNPTWVNSLEKEQTVQLNNIKYKIQNNEIINAYDALDIIWMPKYRTNQEIENIIIELIDLFNNLMTDEYLHQILRKCLVLWSGKYILTEENREKAIRGLKMTQKEIEVASQDILDARIDGMICRAEQEGMEKGMEKGISLVKLETAKKMLNKGFDMEDIIEITGLSKNIILNSK